MNCSTPGLPVHHQLPEFTQTHVHWVSDAIQPSHPLSSPSPPAPSPSQHKGLFQWVNSSHEVAKVLEFQLQHQSFQWTPRREMQIKTTMRYHFMLVWMALIKKSTNNKSWRGCGVKGTLLLCWWECKLIQPLWKMVWRFLEKLGIKSPYDPEIPPRHILCGNQNGKRQMYPIVHCSTIYNS